MPVANPVPSFCFSVLLLDADPTASSSQVNLVGAGVQLAKSAIRGSFAEVSGLNGGMETEEYREGGNNTGPHKFIKWGKYPNVVLKRGVTSNSDLWDWYYTSLYASANPIRKNAVITLNDRQAGQSPTAVWFVRNALPESLQGPNLNARNNEIAIETLELVHEGLYRISLAMIPGIGTAAPAATP
jgi:phage tail-like protein